MSASRRLLMVCLDVASGIFSFSIHPEQCSSQSERYPCAYQDGPHWRPWTKTQRAKRPAGRWSSLHESKRGRYVGMCVYENTCVCVCLCLWVHLSIDLRAFLWSLMLFSNLTLRSKLPPTALEPSTANPRVQPVCWHHRSDMKKQLRMTCACSATLSDKHTLLQETLLRLYMFFCTGLSFQI